MDKQHWRERARDVLAEARATNSLADSGFAPLDSMSKVANISRSACRVLEEAVAETPGEALNFAWSEGVKFALLEVLAQRTAFTSSNAAVHLARDVVRKAATLKRGDMRQGTETGRLAAVMEEVVELLEDIPDEIDLSQVVRQLSEALDIREQVLAKLVAALDELKLMVA
jgi:hypothetical protein